MPFGLRPRREGMACQGVVAILAGVISGAAFHFDGDDVEGRVVVEAASLGVEFEAVDLGCGWQHGVAEGPTGKNNKK